MAASMSRGRQRCHSTATSWGHTADESKAMSERAKESEESKKMQHSGTTHANLAGFIGDRTDLEMIDAST